MINVEFMTLGWKTCWLISLPKWCKYMWHEWGKITFHSYKNTSCYTAWLYGGILMHLITYNIFNYFNWYLKNESVFSWKLSEFFHNHNGNFCLLFNANHIFITNDSIKKMQFQVMKTWTLTSWIVGSCCTLGNDTLSIHTHLSYVCSFMGSVNSQ